MCFVCISEQTTTISLYNINRLVFITKTECVYCVVGIECLYIINVHFRRWSVTTKDRVRCEVSSFNFCGGRSGTALGHVYLRPLPLSPVSTIPPMLYMVFLRLLPLSPVSTIPPMLHTVFLRLLLLSPVSTIPPMLHRVFLRPLPLSPVSTIPPMLHTVFLQLLPLSPVSTIPQMLHIHLRLYVALKNTIRTNGRSLGTFQKTTLFRIYRSIVQTITFIFFVLRGLPAYSLQRYCCLELRTAISHLQYTRQKNNKKEKKAHLVNVCVFHPFVDGT